MKDLLPSIAGSQPSGSSDIENPFQSQSLQQPSRQPNVMADFFKDVSDMKDLLKDIDDCKSRLKTTYERSKSATRTEDVTHFKAERAAIATHVKEKALKARKCLELLDKKNADARKMPGNEAGSTNDRTRTTITLGLQKKLKDQLVEFEAYQKKITDDQHQQAARQLFARTGHKPSEDMVEKAVNEGVTGLFSRGFAQQEDGKGHVLDTLAEITERREAVKQLEKSLIELHQIFLDMAVLVEAQGEELDNIEAQVAKSHEYVAKGTEQLVQARELQKSSRKYMCYSLICLAVILLIVGLSIAGSFG
mmetsp:Transcript_21995/g.61047  ORF Transcript_21995/g.61047 Transcript_21995/m.61047 type:complete len:306 (-) Transcript_21995:162-1079(-)|eukprot:CAMPEP_0117682716 /NCGR_PEP_ID=MMETSP0804-20121206/19864_1 /TAXON_ID=1074897 /ORGANISM="Tetraselmis astigmatica, Strain CCMP880" /LENGTH=305 /DNA_ID=CAMNT_0005492959 /DNA_START=112 /DNA_END=1029 /DNA_ORIENTATION=-